MDSLGTVFFSVGEPSGDLHGANLVRALQTRCPQARFMGMGGPRMQDAGCDIMADVTHDAVIGFGGAMARYPKYRRLLGQIDRLFRQVRPDVVILIDYPGFNWHVARCARRSGIPVVYYGVPQLWAWAPWRVARVRKWVNLVLCKLPFEPSWFAERQVDAEYVGHPYFDELTERHLDQAFIESVRSGDDPIVTLLPGSRVREVVGLTPWFLDAVSMIRTSFPRCRFLVASFNERQADVVRRMLHPHAQYVEVHVGRAAELIDMATCCLACSGSVSLELLYHRKPSVIAYRVGLMEYLLQDVMRTARYITLANLIAAENIYRRPWSRLSTSERGWLPFPEYVAVRNCAPHLAEHVCQWLQDRQSLVQKVEELDRLAVRFVQPGASGRAAQRIVDFLAANKAARHFDPSPRSAPFSGG